MSHLLRLCLPVSILTNNDLSQPHISLLNITTKVTHKLKCAIQNSVGREYLNGPLHSGTSLLSTYDVLYSFYQPRNI